MNQDELDDLIIQQETLETEIESVEDENNFLKDRAKEIRHEIDELEGELVEIGCEIDTNESTVTNIQRDLNHVRNRISLLVRGHVPDSTDPDQLGAF